MTKSELESKPLAELHALAAEADVPRYRMLRRVELIEKLAGGDAAGKPRERRESRPRRERRPRERSEGSRERAGERKEGSQRRERSNRRERPQRSKPAQPQADKPESPADRSEPTYEKSPEAPAAEERKPRRRRRRRFGRKRKELRLHDLVASTSGGRQTIVYAETREGCTKLLRELAAELAGESNGSDPIALLIDPGPEELAEWRREAPQAEIVAAAQARHAEDAIAQATRRAESGENVIVLIDSLTRLAGLSDPESSTDLLDAARSVTIVAALEHH
ncbi:MAG TPA: Rho termination factor N-terminal domain-containing protein [Solirubrobacterales bacterium]